MTGSLWGVLAAALVAITIVRGPAFGLSADDLRKSEPPENGIWLETLDLRYVCQEWGSAMAAKSVQGKPIAVCGVAFEHGVGTHAESEIEIDLNGSATGFASVVGLDDETGGKGSVCFDIWVDGRKVADSGTLRGGQSKLLSADLAGAERLLLRVTDGGDGIDLDHADWAGAVLLHAGAATRPQMVQPPPELAPEIASGVAPGPAIHGPRIVGATPGKPFLFLIPATGEGPLVYSAEGLPEGLSVDPTSGIITGAIQRRGTYIAKLRVTGARGETTRQLKIVSGDHKLALTPPMGWNSWNVWAGAVDADKVRAAADWMARSGLAAHGFQYINIDDCWEADRDELGEVRPNAKFPDMKALADYVHGKGLKIGIYSSPGPQTCAGFEGSWEHEAQDAATYARWGFSDYLKYDWCSYGQIAKPGSLEDMQKPYRVMRTALDGCDRDIVYSLCQYGMGGVWKWGAGVGGNCWRTTGDITDNWKRMSGIGFGQSGREKFAGPGHWNDLDMLVVGKLGWGPAPRPTKLTPNEQITHVTLWCLLASPLLLGCDLSQLDQFSIDLLTNDEALDVNQDPLGKPASRKSVIGSTEVWARPLWDGTLAVGLFNRGCGEAEVTARWSDLGITGRQPVRDLWRKKDLGLFDEGYKAVVPRHGAALAKIGKPDKIDW